MRRVIFTGWGRSVLTAMLTVALSAAAIGQGQPRISSRESDFNDLNRLSDGARSPQLDFGSGGSLRTTPQVDLSRVDQRALRNLLTESVTESEKLYRALESDYQRNKQLRVLLSDLVRQRARASQLSQDVQDGIGLERLLPRFQQLSSDWRLLSHQLRQSPGVSRTTLQSVERIDRLERSMEKMFNMDPQLDQRQVLQELSVLRGSLRNLIDELELDPQGGQQTLDLVYDSRKLEQQAGRVEGMLLDQYGYEQIVTEYNRYGQMWKSLATRLRPLDNRYVERSVRRIMDSDDKLHDLLWLEKRSNREHLKQVADDLTRDVDEFFNRTPLKLLLHFDNVASVLETADTFYGVVQNFKDALNRNESDQEILQSYSFVESYGADFLRSFAGLRSQAGRVVLKEIEDGIASLRNDLNVSGSATSVNTQTMLPVAANLENLADHLRFDVRQWLEPSRESYRADALKATDRFVQRTQRVHRMLQSRPSIQELQQETASLWSEWKDVHGYLGRCNTEDRQHMINLARDITAAIYQLRSPLELAMR